MSELAGQKLLKCCIGSLASAYFILMLGLYWRAALCQSGWNYQTQYIHQFWPSIRTQPESLGQSTTTEKSEPESHEGAPPRSSTTLVYGSPICIGQCLILQIYWSNSSTTLLNRKLPSLPTFPKPREIK